MGDRANFLVKQHDGNYLCIYGHWAGEGMFDTLAHALNRVLSAGREGHESYANRILISDMVDNDSDLGWGVSINALPDNEHSIPVVNFEEFTVSLYDSPLGKYGGGDFDLADFPPENAKFVMPIDVFIRKYLKTVDAKPLTYTRV